MQFSKLIAALGLTLVTLSAAANTAIGKSEIYGVKVIKDTDTEYVVEVDYYYNGEYGPSVGLGVIAKQQADDLNYHYRPYSAKVGRHKQNVEVLRAEHSFQAYQTKTLDVQMWEAGKTPFLVKSIALVKNWPDVGIFSATGPRKIEGADPRVEMAIELIDSIDRLGDDRLAVAKRYLDAVVLDNPKDVRAYIELARVYMKNDLATSGHRDSDGVTQAERVLNVALQIDPNYADTHVLLGYVYAVQNKSDKAVEALEKAERIGTKNMWLYYNWGLALQNAAKKDQAIRKYREAIAKPYDWNDKSLKSHNRAVPHIYDELIKLLEEKQNWNEIDEVYKKRISLFNDDCDKARYAKFRLMKLGDYDGAISNARTGLNQRCGAIAGPILASAYLTKWNDKSQRMPEQERQKLFHQAQALLTDSPRMLYLLAQSTHTSTVIEGLKKTGISVDIADNQGATPLAYAVMSRDSVAAEALLHYGADPNRPVNVEKWTPLMLAVANGDSSMVDLLLESGADASKRSTSGITAESIARELGHADIARKVSAKRGT